MPLDDQNALKKIQQAIMMEEFIEKTTVIVTIGKQLYAAVSRDMWDMHVRVKAGRANRFTSCPPHRKPPALLCCYELSGNETTYLFFKIILTWLPSVKNISLWILMMSNKWSQNPMNKTSWQRVGLIPMLERFKTVWIQCKGSSRSQNRAINIYPTFSWQACSSNRILLVELVKNAIRSQMFNLEIRTLP